MTDVNDWWYPTRVDADLVSELREDYPEECSGLSDDGVLEYFEYDRGGFRATALWDNLGDAKESYNALANAYLKMIQVSE